MNSNVLALAAAALLTAGPASALQTITVRDGVAVQAVVAAREATRIRVEGAKIIDVVGNIYSSTCSQSKAGDKGAAELAAPGAPAVNPQGEFVLGCDLAKGEIFVRPVGQNSKPINIFVSTASATYTLLLRRSDTPSDTIVLVDKSAPRRVQAEPGARSPYHMRTLKEMMLAMTSGRPGDAVTVQEVGQPIKLWKEADFELVRSFAGRDLKGEEYRLTNISAAPMVLAEQEFDREGGGVLAVAIDNLNLRPGEATAVYVIKSAEAP